MTIRKRYDEAQILIRQGLYEPALTVLLIGVAGAAERWRRHETNNAKKEHGDDPRWFIEYTKGTVPMVVGERHAAEILYKDLRCELVHEAKIDSANFATDQYLILGNNGQITFGLGLLAALSERLRTDPLGREEFRDLLSPFENIIKFSGVGYRHFRQNFSTRHNISDGRIDILEQILTGFRPEVLAQMSYAEMKTAFTDTLMPNLALFGLNGDALTGLRSADTPILAGHNTLTPMGHMIIRDLSGSYSTADAA